MYLLLAQKSFLQILCWLCCVPPTFSFLTGEACGELWNRGHVEPAKIRILFGWRSVRPRADPTWSACRAGLEASFSYHRARQRVACYFLQNGLLQPVADQLLISLNRSALCDYSSERSFVHLEFLTHPMPKADYFSSPPPTFHMLLFCFGWFFFFFFFRNPKICV